MKKVYQVVYSSETDDNPSCGFLSDYVFEEKRDAEKYEKDVIFWNERLEGRIRIVERVLIE